MRCFTSPLVILPVLLAACSGGGADTAAAAPPAPMLLTIDTAAASATAVTVQVVAVAFEDVAGEASPNLLDEPQIVTLADPVGATAGLSLRGLPAGDYAAVHLLIAPGSGVGLSAEGAGPVDVPADLRAAFAAPFAHDGVGGWVDIRHATAMVWRQFGISRRVEPMLVAEAAAGRPFRDEPAWIGQPVADGVAALLGNDALPVTLAIAADAELTDVDGLPMTREEFLNAPTDLEILFDGSVDADGDVRVDRARQVDRSDRPRVIGRITELINDHQGFVMNVQAIVRDPRANRDRIEVANVLADDAEIFWSHTHRRLAFTELRVGDLAKVDYSARDGATFTARRIEITGPRDGQVDPLLHGRVLAVDVATNRLVLGPIGDDPLTWNGQTWTSLEARVTAATVLQRRGPRGSLVTITLADIVAGDDQVWLRGHVDADALVADSVLVRAGH